MVDYITYMVRSVKKRKFMKGKIYKKGHNAICQRCNYKYITLEVNGDVALQYMRITHRFKDDDGHYRFGQWSQCKILC